MEFTKYKSLNGKRVIYRNEHALKVVHIFFGETIGQLVCQNNKMLYQNTSSFIVT